MAMGGHAADISISSWWSHLLQNFGACSTGCCRATDRDDRTIGSFIDAPIAADKSIDFSAMDGTEKLHPLAPVGISSLSDSGTELVELPTTEVPPGRSMYTGQWKGREFHGKGHLLREDGSHYVGDFQEGKAHGNGKFRAANGNVYEGEWLLDRAHGYGTYSHDDGSMYVGQWLNDEKCGTGTESYADCSRYEGEFRHNSKNGNGKFVSSLAKMIFQGQMKQDKMHGEGTYFFTDGRVFTGQWKHGLRQGEGYLRWPDGRSYRGQWREGKQDGHGVMEETDGSKTKGPWYQGQLGINPTETDELGDMKAPPSEASTNIEAPTPHEQSSDDDGGMAL